MWSDADDWCHGWPTNRETGMTNNAQWLRCRGHLGVPRPGCPCAAADWQPVRK
jgi:hypothetical protein